MADKVVVDGELSMDTVIDGDLQLESQVEGTVGILTEVIVTYPWCEGVEF